MTTCNGNVAREKSFLALPTGFAHKRRKSMSQYSVVVDNLTLNKHVRQGARAL